MGSVRRTALLAGSLLLALAWAVPVRAEADLPAPASATDAAAPRSSLPIWTADGAWRQAGFRLQLGYLYGGVLGHDGAPSAQTHAVAVRAGARLGQQVGFFAHLQYALAVGDIFGARFLGTIEPTWHPTPHSEVGLGLGFGGFVEGRGSRPERDAALRSELVASYTYPSASPPLPRCMGAGPAALLRAARLWPLGTLGAVGLQGQLDGQWTLCEDDVGRIEPDTARPIIRRQWWPHTGASLGVVFAWR